MNIGFYLQNNNISDVDCTDPMSGNPGIGGTEYLFIATALALSTYVKNHRLDYNIVLLANNRTKLPSGITVIEAHNDNLQEIAKKFSIDLLIIRYSLDNYNVCRCLDGISKIVMWAHNFIKRTELSLLYRDNNISSIVCVGSEQLNMYRDHQAYYKSVVILNGYPIKEFLRSDINCVTPFNKRKNEVTFLGNLVDYKGFHILAAAWKKVLCVFPDAHLNVIGGGKLYDRNQKLGKYGIAEESYENMFMKHLVDDSGNILPSVTFHGVMGNEKAEILNLTKVGVPNPSGVSETFCIAALELQLWGAIISTINYGGFKDTVFKTGILYNSTNQLADSIICQLKKTDNEYSQLIEFSGKFDFNKIAKDWVTLFSAIDTSKDLSNILKPKLYDNSYLGIEINRKIKRLLPFGKFLPTMMFYKSILNRLRRLL